MRQVLLHDMHEFPHGCPVLQFLAWAPGVNPRHTKANTAWASRFGIVTVVTLLCNELCRRGRLAAFLSREASLLLNLLLAPSLDLRLDPERRAPVLDARRECSSLDLFIDLGLSHADAGFHRRQGK